jgi:hypothetical protein
MYKLTVTVPDSSWLSCRSKPRWLDTAQANPRCAPPPTTHHLGSIWNWWLAVPTRSGQPATEGACPLHKLSGITPIGPEACSTPAWRHHGLGCWQRGPLPQAAVPGYPPQYGAYVPSPSCRRRRRETPFSVVFTDWLSMIAALGVGSRPSASLTLGRRVSWIRSQVPSLRHCRKYHQTVPQGGKSCGSIRQVCHRAGHTRCR